MKHVCIQPQHAVALHIVQFHHDDFYLPKNPLVGKPLFKFTVQPQRASFSWLYNIQDASLIGLINQIQTADPEIEFTDATLITFVEGYKRNVIRSDADLQKMLKISKSLSSYEITINLETRIYTPSVTFFLF